MKAIQLSRTFAVLCVAAPMAAADVHVNAHELLTEHDLLAGIFMGQSFELGPQTTISINRGGTLDRLGSLGFAREGAAERGEPRYLPLNGSELRLAHGSQFLASTIGSGLRDVRLRAEPGSRIWDFVEFSDECVVDFSGTADSNISFNAGSLGDIRGGYIDRLIVKDGSTVTVSGGRQVSMSSAPDASLVFEGNEFLLAGEPIDNLPDGVPLHDLFTGTLADGSVFILESAPTSMIESITFGLVDLPEPSRELIVVPEHLVPIGGLRKSERLLLLKGGELPSDYRAVDASINVLGGLVGQRLTASGTQFTLQEGTVLGSAHTPSAIFHSSSVRIKGGSLRSHLIARRGTSVDVSGGYCSEIDIHEGSMTVSGGKVNQFSSSGITSLLIEGGIIGHGHASDDSVIEITGGTVEESLRFDDRSTLMIKGGYLPEQRSLAHTTTMEGGSIGMHATVPYEGTLVMSGGSIVSLSVEEGGTLEIAGGHIENGTTLRAGSSLILTGGTIGSNLTGWVDSNVVQTGGHLGDDAVFWQQSSIIISGGTVGDRFKLQGNGSSLEIIAQSVTLDGVPIGLDAGDRIRIDDRNVDLEAVLSDGTTLDFFLNSDFFAGDLEYFSPSAILTVVGAPASPCGRADLAQPIGTLDLSDIVGFVSAFLTQQHAADMNNNGSFGLDDLSLFIEAFEAGCGS